MLMLSKYNGSKGVELAVRLLEDEFKSAMALAGCVLHIFLEAVANIGF